MPKENWLNLVLHVYTVVYGNKICLLNLSWTRYNSLLQNTYSMPKKQQ